MINSAFLILGTGFLFTAEPLAMFIPNLYGWVNEARSQRRLRILIPAGVVMFIWGGMCMGQNFPPILFVDWFLLLVGLLFLFKGFATIFFSRRLARVSQEILEDPRRRVYRCGMGIGLGLVIMVWGLSVAIEA